MKKILPTFFLGLFLTCMIFYEIPRVVSYGFLFLFFLSSVFLFHGVRVDWKVKKKVLILFLYMLSIVIKDIVLAFSGEGVRAGFLFYDIASLLFFLSLFLLYSLDNWRVSFLYVSMYFYFLGAILSLGGLLLPKSIFDVVNLGPALMLPGAFVFLSSWSERSSFLKRVLLASGFGMAFAFSLLVQARGVTLGLLVGGLVFFMQRQGMAWLASIMGGVITLAVLFFSLVVASNYSGDPVLNKIFTHRPLIWGVYYREVQAKSPVVGLGPVAEASSKAAGDMVKDEMGGGKKSYGAHSIFIQSFYTNGFLGLVFLSVIILSLMRKSYSPWWPGVVGSVVMCLLSSTYLGAPNIYGFALSCALIIDINTRGVKLPLVRSG